MISVKSYLLSPAVVIINMMLNICAGGYQPPHPEGETCYPMPTCTNSLTDYTGYYVAHQLFEASSSLLQYIRRVLTSSMRESAYQPKLRQPHSELPQSIQSGLTSDIETSFPS
jgi:hypothetical protein